MKKTFILLIFVFFVLSCSKTKQKKSVLEDFNYKKALSFLYKKNDSAFYYFNKVTTNTKDSLHIAQAYSSMAAIQTDEGDYFGSQESLLTSLKFLNEKKDEDLYCISADYNELGLNSRNLKNYEASIAYYNLALKFSKDDGLKLTISNNIAAVYRDDKKYLKALKIYKEIISAKNNDRVVYARILTNISFTKWLYNSKYNAAPELLKALNIRIKENDSWGQNSSYAHLADYYAIKEPHSALVYALKMYAVSKQIKSPDDQREALQKLIKLSSPQETKKYFEAYQKLDDSIQTARNAAKNQFALIRYDAEKNKVDFLKVQAENIQKQNDILRRNIVLIILTSCLFAGYWWYRKRKKGLQQEKELEVKNTEIKYVKKIHDRVANKVYQVMSEVENTPQFDRDVLLDKLENLYNISRDISYESKELNTEKNYAQQLTEMISSYATSAIEIFIIENEEKLWEGITNDARAEVFYIVQEWMTNMKKHSRAETVVLKFQRNDSEVIILYSDNGVGLQDAAKKNGLQNTETRIKSIRGTITFDNTQKSGLEVWLSFPFS